MCARELRRTGGPPRDRRRREFSSPFPRLPPYITPVRRNLLMGALRRALRVPGYRLDCNVYYAWRL